MNHDASPSPATSPSAPTAGIVEQIRPALVSMLLLTVLCGIAYPMAITALAELTMPRSSRGSLLEIDGRVVGSELIGQPFEGPSYLWGRLSATAPVPYAASSAATLTGSAGSNLAATNPALLEAARTRVAALLASPHEEIPIPADLVTASASGLDPHISPAAARWQVPRIAAARGISHAEVQAAIDAATEGRTFGVLGEPRVNVLLANHALDRTGAPHGGPHPLRSAP